MMHNVTAIFSIVWNGELEMVQYDVAIVGGGPAGLFSAIMCARSGLRVMILEKNKDFGRKLLLTGAGKCNLTQDAPIEDFLERYGKNGKYLKHALLSYTNKDLMDFFIGYGMKFVTGDNGKIFPRSMKAQDILDVLLRECQQHNVQMLTGTTVTNILDDDGFRIETSNDTYSSKHVIVATGGMSYPHTGSTGDGQAFAKSLGHKIIPMKPALTPIAVREHVLADLSGLSFNDIAYTLWRNGRKIGNYQGDVLLTHKGVSGPGILNPSRDMVRDDVLRFNFVDGNVDMARSDLTKSLADGGKKLVKTIISELKLPKRLLEKILELAEIDDGLKCAELGKENRLNLLRLLTEFEMKVKDIGNFNLAIDRKSTRLNSSH